jgi:selenide, water dikinase
VLGALPVTSDARVLVDYRTSDDAGVYALDDEQALVQTVDFFTPIVDDPETYGRIAAANALSDVYAMGGRPMTALAIACFPKDGDRDVLAAILRGGRRALEEAGVALLGGHTVQDAEIKFGFAVTGLVRRTRIWTNGGARVGDRLILTKPLGTGVIATALKFERAPQETIARAVRSMTETNQAAAQALATLPDGAVHACTDITGFGLIGHGTEMARASGMTLEIEVAAVPIIEGVLDLIDSNSPGGARTNHEHYSGGVRPESSADAQRMKILYDPQTSGGLLIAVDEAAAEPAVAALKRVGCEGWLIGRVGAPSPYAIRLY